MPKGNIIAPLQSQGKVELARDRLRQFISGSLEPGDKLPTVRELEKSLQVSRTTIFSALSGLAAEGIIKAVHGSGYFAAEAPVPAASTVAILYMNNPVKGEGITREYQITTLVEGIQRQYRNLNFRLLPFTADSFPYSPEDLKEFNALVINGMLNPSECVMINDMDIPVITFGSGIRPQLKDSYDFSFDNYAQARNFLTEMKNTGHKRCGLAAYSDKPVENFQNVHREVFGDDPEAGQIIILRDREEDEPEFERISRIFDSLQNTPAWLLVDEYITNHFIRECLERGVKIPEDVSVASCYYSNTFFNISPAAITCTDILSYSRQLGTAAGKTLMKILSGNPPRQHNYKIIPEICLGESIGRINR